MTTPAQAPFDPFYYEQQDFDKNSLTVLTAEKLVLVQAGESAPNEALSDGYREQAVPEDCDLFVNADVVRIAGALIQRERAVQINARVIEFCAGADGTPPLIDVSGRPGPAPSPDPVAPKPDRAASGTAGYYTHNSVPWKQCDYTPPTPGASGHYGKDGAAGAKGGDAGWVDLRCDTLVGIDGATLAINAKGGTGGKGQGGQPGQDGGNGAKGADATHHNTTVDEATNGSNAGRRGAGGRGGAAGKGGSGGTVNVLTVSPLTAKPVVSIDVGSDGAAGTKGDDGNDGTPGAGGAGADYVEGSSYTTYHLAPGVGGGYQDAIAQPAQNVVVQPTPQVGASSVQGNNTYDTVKYTASADQLAMLLDFVRIQAVNVKHKRGAQTDLLKAQLDWLVGICGEEGSEDLSQSDPKTSIGIAAAGVRRNLLDPTRDAFGNPPDWVPFASLAEYDTLLGDATRGSLSILKEAEAEWQAYSELRKNAQEVRSQVQSAIDSADSKLADIETQMETTRQQLSDKSADITDLASDVSDAKTKAQAAIANVKKLANDKLNLDPWKYLDVIEQTAQAMYDPVAAGTVYGAEQLKFWKSTFTTLKGDDGQTYDKDIVIKQMDSLNDDLGNLDESFQVYDDGFLQANDPDGYKLLASQEAIKNLLDTFKSSVGGVQNAEDAIENYVQVVLKRNGLILDYNAALAQLAQLKSSADQLTADKAHLSATSAALSLPVADRFMQGLYERAKQAVLTDLYSASRAYRFWLLSGVDVFADAVSGNYSDLTYLSASTAKQRIETQSASDINTLLQHLELRSKPVVITYEVRHHPEILASFKKTRGTKNKPRPPFWEFTLQAPTKDTTIEENPFADMTNVRLDEVRCWLLGLKSTDNVGNVKVHITQRGDEQIAPPSGDAPVSMRHEPIPAMFEYSTKGTWPDDKAILTHATYWVPRESWGVAGLPSCTPIGPFATWRIALRPEDFDGYIKWDTLTAIRLEFFVRIRGLDTAS